MNYKDLTTRKQYYSFCEAAMEKESAERNDKFDYMVYILNKFPISQKTKDNFQSYFDHLLNISDYAEFDGLVYTIIKSMDPWLISLNSHSIFQLLEQQSDNNAMGLFFDICKNVKSWPTRSREGMFQYFNYKRQADIEKVLSIINLPFYSVGYFDDKLDEIWLITSSVFKRCSISYEKLTNIFDDIRYMESTALNLAWMHLMETFTTETASFDEACVILRKIIFE